MYYVFKQGYVSQTPVQMKSRSRSSCLKMLLPSWCPVRSHHWSVTHKHKQIQILQGFHFSCCVSELTCVCVFEQVKDCLDHSTLPMDGATLTEALHQRGINARYLGNVLQFVDKTPAKAQLEHFYVSLIPRIWPSHTVRTCVYSF